MNNNYICKSKVICFLIFIFIIVSFFISTYFLIKEYKPIKIETLKQTKENIHIKKNEHHTKYNDIYFIDFNTQKLVSERVSNHCDYRDDIKENDIVGITVKTIKKYYKDGTTKTEKIYPYFEKEICLKK